MKRCLAVATIIVTLHLGIASAASDYPCAKEARGKAEVFLTYHFGDDRQTVGVNIDNDVTKVRSIGARQGEGGERSGQGVSRDTMEQ